MTEDVSDEEIEKLEEELKKLESKDTSYGVPSTTQKDNMFKFFRSILKIKDTTRVANLTKLEVGMSDLSVRGWQRIAHYAEAENLKVVAEYLTRQSEIITSTSMGVKGFWSQLFVTNIKKEQRLKDKTPEKKKWFASKDKSEGSE